MVEDFLECRFLRFRPPFRVPVPRLGISAVLSSSPRLLHFQQVSPSFVGTAPNVSPILHFLLFFLAFSDYRFLCV